jgi:hypothetical protein
MESSEEFTLDQFAAWWKQTGERELRQLLYWRWDPLSVSSEFPYTWGEYDGYAPQIVSALRRGATRDEIAAVLREFETGPMGLGEPVADRQAGYAHQLAAMADRIAVWFEHSQDSWSNFGPKRF